MSRTDKTNPWFVKQHYEHSYIQPIHDHRFHECNLPPRPTEKDSLDWQGHDDRDCFWWPSFDFYRSRWAKCPCSGCRMMFGYGAKSPRQKRHDAKLYCQDKWNDEY